MKSRKALMIVDPQVDFVNGSLPVDGAPEVMDKLAEYIAHNPDEYRLIIITADNHPDNHCSFKENGGEWPRHCVARSDGSSIVSPLQNALKVNDAPYVVLAKGQHPEVEEYSIFKNPIAAKKIVDLINEYDIDQIDVCGIAGDVCVYNTLTDAFNFLKGIKIKVLKQFCASIDGGLRLNQLPDEIVL
ncbi:MAG: isochorismatase family protein [Muribaculaceae bacterium]|nr:isochorismatase family protein [Muribaculaceae bacterium]